MEAIARVQHAPEALIAQRAKITDLQLKIEESMLNIVKVSERLISQKKLSETSVKPKSSLFSTVMRRFPRNEESRRLEETYLT